MLDLVCLYNNLFFESFLAVTVEQIEPYQPNETGFFKSG